MKVRNLISFNASLKKLLIQDLPVKISFKLGKLIKPLNEEYKIFAENKKKLFTKYGEEEKGQVKIKPENTKAFTKDFEELLNIEVEIDIPKIKVDDLGDIKISPLDMSNLDILIQE